jgi:hypothetical protein
MTRLHIYALLTIDGGWEAEEEAVQWLLQQGYLADDGSEIFVTARGDELLNKACALHSPLVSADTDDVLNELCFSNLDDLETKGS